MPKFSQKPNEFGRTVLAKIEEHFPGAILESIAFLGELTVVIDRASVTDVCTFLRDDSQLSFNSLCDVSAVDMWPQHPRFEINVHLMVLPRDARPNQGVRRLRLKVRLDEHEATMPTLTSVWPAAAWYERETHELFGIYFEGHPDLRPLLVPDDWDGPPPMRRDVPVHVEEVAFSFNQERIHSQKPFAKE